MFDIVVPVFNAMHHVRACIEGVFRYSSLPFHLYLVDDASKAYTAQSMAEQLAAYDPSLYTVITHEENQGYLKSCNAGIAAGANPFVIALNSDAMVTPGYLEKVRDAFASDPKIAILNPVSNWANWTRIPFPDGYNVIELTQEVENLSYGEIPDINNASGFFFAMRREALDKTGLFDEVYGMGYWEETDLCMRALQAGYRVVVDDSLFIFHHGWGTFADEGRNENMDRNEAVFMQRWGKQYEKIKNDWKKRNPIEYLQRRIEKPALWERKGMLSATGRGMSVAQVQRRLDALMDVDRPLEEIRADIRAHTPEAAPPDARRKVIYILPAVVLYGGIISALQVVNQLVMRGYDANVATYGKVDESVFKLFPTYFRPYSFPDMATMVAEFPDCDLVVATKWETVYAAQVLKEIKPELELAYYVQDFEPDFYLPEYPKLAAQAERTYSIIRHQIVKTRWLKDCIEEYGGNVRRIPLGLNLDYFHNTGRKRMLQIISLARPSSLRRNFNMLKEVYAELHKRRPDIQLALYGEGYTRADLPFPVKSYGKLTKLEDVAHVLNTSTILLDCSTFQGFGRPGLEAMACGAAAVLTREGGITQYAKHDYNCLLIDPNDKMDIVTEILELIDNPPKRAYLVHNGYKTAREYSLVLEGERTAAFLEELGLRPAMPACAV